MTVTALLIRPLSGVADSPMSPVNPADWIFVSETVTGQLDSPGCGAVSAFDVESGGAVFLGEVSYEPGRLAASGDLSIVVAGPASTWGPEYGHLYVVRLQSDGTWSAIPWVGGTSFAPMSGITILPDGDSILVATARYYVPPHRPPAPPPAPEPPQAPFGLEKYRLSEIRDTGRLAPRLEALGVPERRLGRRHGRMETPGMPAQILAAPDSALLHVITENEDWQVLTIDPATLQEVASRITLPPLTAYPVFRGPLKGTGWIAGSLSLDGRYLVTGRGAGDHRLNVADLVERRAWVVPLDEPVAGTVGTAVNRGWINTGLLALHHHRFVGVYQWEPPDGFMLLARVPLSGSTFTTVGSMASVEWGASGQELIAVDFDIRPGVIHEDFEFSVHRIDDGGRSSTFLHHVYACFAVGANGPVDILTGNGLLVPTPTSTVPTATPTPSSTPTQPVAPSATPTSIPTVTPPPTASPLRRVYLPIAELRHCVRSSVSANVVLALDASSSMLEEVRPGYRKLDAAIAAASQFLDRLRPPDQVALVTFDDSAALAQTLTSDFGAPMAALAGLATAQHTRIDLGIRMAREELASERRRGENRPVLILLTDGKANPVPITAAEAEASLAKAAGITIFTIGLGEPEELDHEALSRIASSREYYYQTPDANDLTAVYAAIAGEIPCPAIDPNVGMSTFDDGNSPARRR